MGNLHVEPNVVFTLQSPMHIKRFFEMFKEGKINKPIENCFCSHSEKMEIEPDKASALVGCSCETWYPWNEEQKKKAEGALESIKEGFKGNIGWSGWRTIRRILMDHLNCIKNPQMQWLESGESRPEPGKIFKFGRMFKLIGEVI